MSLSLISGPLYRFCPESSVFLSWFLPLNHQFLFIKSQLTYRFPGKAFPESPAEFSMAHDIEGARWLVPQAP